MILLLEVPSSFPKVPPLFNTADYHPPLSGGWRFTCIVPAPKAAEEAIYWPMSICSAAGGVSAKDAQLNRLPKLLLTELPMPSSPTRTFLIFNATGLIEDWRRYLVQNSKPDGYRAQQSAQTLNWTSTEDGIWVHLRPPPGSIDARVSISACVTNLPGVYQNVSMSSDHDDFEPSLSWDKANAKYETASIRDRYVALWRQSDFPRLEGHSETTSKDKLGTSKMA